MTTDLQQLWRINRNWRRWMDANTSFVTPSVIDTLRYSLIEASEALDAWMRSQNPGHARNNGREHTIEQELADTAMLLLTALPSEFVEEANLRIPEQTDLDRIIMDISRGVYACGYLDGGYGAVWACYLAPALRKIEYYPGFDLATELGKCHRRLALKHGGEAYARCLQLASEIEPWLVEKAVQP